MGIWIIPTSSFPFVFHCWLHSYVMWCSLGLQLKNIRLHPWPWPRPRPDLQSQIRPNPAPVGFEKIKSGATLVRTHTKKLGKSSKGLHLRRPKRVLCVFVCHHNNADFRSFILHQFSPLLKQKTWTRVRMRTPVKNFQISSQGILQVPKTAKMGTFEAAQFRTMGIISGTSRHPKDVSFVSEFWWATYGLGAISPQKQQISLISPRPYFTVQHHSPGGSRRHAFFEPILQCVPRYTATRLVDYYYYLDQLTVLLLHNISNIKKEYFNIWFHLNKTKKKTKQLCMKTLLQFVLLQSS